ncbi:DUF4349 domain-containing protein [Nakamurella sp.]|uniref:DUF4349 domain-containing protein n=1 Tax=Nakamurella sp. TaxID=1869182 RepID=UPI003784E9ED
MRRIPTKRAATRVLAPALLAVLAASLVACTSQSASDSGNAAAYSGSAAAMATQAAPERANAGADAAAGEAAAPPAPDSAGSAGGSAGGSTAGGQILGTVPVDGTQVIRTADLTVRLEVQPVTPTDDASADRDANARTRADAVAAAAGSLRGTAATVGGFVAGADGGGSQMSVTLRVPANQYDAVLDKIAGLGQVTGRTESSQDVTAQIVDVNSRVASMTASVARVRALLDQATSIADVISIESELASREADLEALQQQQAYLQGQVAMSTMTVGLMAVTLPAAGETEPAPDTGFVAGIKAGWDNLLQFLTWLGALIGGLLPWLPLIAIVVGIGWWAARRLRRPGSGRTGSVPPAPVDPEPNQARADEESREPAGVS